jgi:hypothetical protein
MPRLLFSPLWALLILAGIFKSERLLRLSTFPSIGPPGWVAARLREDEWPMGDVLLPILECFIPPISDMDPLESVWGGLGG